MTDRRENVNPRWIVVAVAAGTLVFVCSQHQNGGIKGSSVPLIFVVLSVAVGAITAAVTRLIYNSTAGKVAAPFLGGIAGVIASGNAMHGPYGSVVGLLAGTIIVFLPLYRSG